MQICTLQTSYNEFGDPVSYRDESGNETTILFNYNIKNGLGQNVIQKTCIDPTGVKT